MKKVRRVIRESEAAISSKTNGKRIVFRVMKGKASIAATVINKGADLPSSSDVLPLSEPTSPTDVKSR